MNAESIVAALESTRLQQATEALLQDGIEKRLRGLGVEFVREHRFSAVDRVDFFADGGIAMEVKIGGSLTDLTRQLSRYASHADVTELVLITTKLTLSRVPRELNGKPVRVCALLGGL